jgi:hypothetical protein
VCDSAVCAISDVVAVLAMVSLLVAACTYLKVLYRRSVWLEHALAISVYVTLACSLTS